MRRLWPLLPHRPSGDRREHIPLSVDHSPTPVLSPATGPGGQRQVVGAAAAGEIGNPLEIERPDVVGNGTEHGLTPPEIIAPIVARVRPVANPDARLKPANLTPVDRYFSPPIKL